MPTFVKLTEASKAQTPILVNVDLVRSMTRIAPWEGTRYVDKNDADEWVESIVGAMPERTRLWFGSYGEHGTDTYEVLETPDQILERAAASIVADDLLRSLHSARVSDLVAEAKDGAS